MASMTRRGNKHSIRFRYGGQHHRISVIGNKTRAERLKAIIESTLEDLRLQRIEIPPGVEIVDFVASGGKAVLKQPMIGFHDASEQWQQSRIAAPLAG